jgi:hypothetical protein
MSEYLFSGTEAIELVKQFLGALEHESLGECAHRVIETYVACPSMERRLELADQAIVASTLRLDGADDRLMRWAYVFEAAHRAVRLAVNGETDSATYDPECELCQLNNQLEPGTFSLHHHHAY